MNTETFISIKHIRKIKEERNMKKVFAVLLAILLLSSFPAALAEGGVALLLQSASREEAITIPASTLDLGLTMPQAVSLTTKREGDVTTVTLDGPVDEISVNWCAQGEDLEALTVEDGVARYSHQGHPYQEGVILSEQLAVYLTTISALWTEEDVLDMLIELGRDDVFAVQEDYGWDVYMALDNTYGEHAYYVRVGAGIFVYGRDGQLLDVHDSQLGRDFFRSGEDSTFTAIWRRGAGEEWYISALQEIYETGDIAKITAYYGNGEEKRLYSYEIEYAEKDGAAYTVRYGADDALISAQATLDGDAFVNGSGNYAGRWVNSGTWAWAPAGVLRPISDFAVSPRVYEE